MMTTNNKSNKPNGANTAVQRAGAIEVPAMRVAQPGGTFYVTTLTGEQIATEDFSTPDAWTSEHRQGYQRPPLVARFREISKYLRGEATGREPMMPQSILLNSRQPLEFIPSEDDSHVGFLRILPEVRPLFEVDGQHRIGGIKAAAVESDDVAEMSFPVVIGDNIDPLEEAVLFYDINTHQKRVPTDIAQRLIEQQMLDPELRKAIIEKGQAWIGAATKVVDELNKIPDQPWYESIGIPGTSGTVIMRQVSFVQSLKPLLDGTIYEDEDPVELATILSMYWRTIKELVPEAFSAPREFVIQKTVGVYPLHQLLPLVIERVKRMEGKISVTGFKKVLSPIDAWTSSFWHKKGGKAGLYAGAKGFRILFDELKQQLPPMQSIVEG